MRKYACIFVAISLFAGCGGGDSTGTDLAVSDVAGNGDMVSKDGDESKNKDVEIGDFPQDDVGVQAEVVQDDTGVEDPGQNDHGPADVGAPDTSSMDNGPSDPGQPDKGPPTDLGPQYSDMVIACIYVVENICAKMITKCDVLGLIPKEWMELCTDFLVNNEATIAGGCELLDDANFSDPNADLIVSFGPTALKECTDNFECTLENILKIGEFVVPLFQGGEVETTEILTLVADLCFK